MEIKESEKRKNFDWNGKILPLNFVETINVTEGVKCDVYTIANDTEKDLGIIRIEPGKKTPLQKVLKGDRTIEGYISGRGALIITGKSGEEQVYRIGDKKGESLEIEVKVGELMQWQADSDSSLVAYEICFPPYEEGRFENIAG